MSIDVASLLQGKQLHDKCNLRLQLLCTLRLRIPLTSDFHKGQTQQQRLFPTSCSTSFARALSLSLSFPP